jgi:hypothetical protein
MISLEKSLLFLSQFVYLLRVHLKILRVDDDTVIFLGLLEAYDSVLHFLGDMYGIPEKGIALPPYASSCWKRIVPSDTPLIRSLIQSEDMISKSRLAEYLKKCKKS